MTRKDYEAIAAIIKDNLEHKQRINITVAMVAYMEENNPNFDTAKFIDTVYADQVPA